MVHPEQHNQVGDQVFKCLHLYGTFLIQIRDMIARRKKLVSQHWSGGEKKKQRGRNSEIISFKLQSRRYSVAHFCEWIQIFWDLLIVLNWY